MNRALRLALTIVVLLGAAGAGCNHRKRVYANCYCSSIADNSSASTTVITTVVVVCGPCQDRAAGPTSGADHDRGEGKGHQNDSPGHQKHH